MAAECSRCSLEIPKEVLAFLAGFSNSECVQPLWTFSRLGHRYSLKLFWKTESSISPPNNAHSSSRRNNRSRQRMEAFLAKKKALNSTDDDTLTGIPCPGVPDNLPDNLSKPLPSSGTLGSSVNSKATTITAHKGTPTLSLSSSVRSVSDLEEPACESSHFVGAVAKSIPSYSPIAKHTRRQCAAKSELQIDNHDEIQSFTPAFPVRLSIPQLNLPVSLSNVVTKYHADYFRCEDGESASAVRSCMEHEWSDVVKSGQKVKMKFKDDFTSGTVDRVLFVSKQAANSTYFYATAKVIVKLSNNSTCEVQFRDMYL